MRWTPTPPLRLEALCSRTNSPYLRCLLPNRDGWQRRFQQSSAATRLRTTHDYPIGVICALAVEKAAFVAMLDEVHESLPTPKGDDNSYTFGRIGDHNIVAACLPAGMTGNNSAATVAKDMLRSFPIKIGLMVGIGGGAWSRKVDIRLGDVVVSQPDGMHGGVVQWDFGKMESGGFKRTGSLNKPPRPLLNAVQDIKTKHMTEGDRLAEHLLKIAQMIRGICDYADSHKNKRWQPYAAATAAAYAKELLGVIKKQGVDELEPAKISPYLTQFSLDDIPRVRKFVDRPVEMAELERVLLPKHKPNQRQQLQVLHGLGGIGKTQLAVEFARRHHRRFSAVFWLDGRSEGSIKRSIAKCASKIPQGQIPEKSRTYAAGGGDDIDAVVRDVMSWLSQTDNTTWLLIIDNVDREYSSQGGQPEAYDVRNYLSGADHGSVLITTRLARLEQLGESQQLGRVDNAQARAIFESWYRKKYDAAKGECLLQVLDGLPLAIAQAGAYLQESGVSIETYLRFYEQQWNELMESRNETDSPLQDYPDRSVWTTWAISYQAIRSKHEATANLLLLWSFLDNRDLWHGLFDAACQASEVATRLLSEWIGEIARSELAFSRAMQLLRNYSLAEAVEGSAGYTMHPVVHQWAHHYQGKQLATRLGRVAVVAVGWAVPDRSSRHYAAVQRRLLPHVQAGSQWVDQVERERHHGGDTLQGDNREEEELQTVLGATNLLGNLYADQGKLGEAEQMYERALRGYEEVLGPSHTSTLDTVNNLGNLYADQGKLGEAEQIYMRALRGYEEALGPDHTSTLDTVNNLGLLYADQGKLGEAEQMYMRALREYKQALGDTSALHYLPALSTFENLGNLYDQQGKPVEAQAMYATALSGLQHVLGSSSKRCVEVASKIHAVNAPEAQSYS
ncbi:hypothetical protein yc1106_08920 [Curvularia clavata]|uniref:Uncharacterized protein n=1 Tax=Curvularia clavata TaxID=95742 RepID=A0A9Q8ZGG4_CURCL|nr:hypothetical protein yc1106_08920 [Curvularia clavata]